MNTQSHAILTYFAVRRGLSSHMEGFPHGNTLVFSGALAPDLPLYAFFAWYTLVERTPQMVIWRDVYFQAGWLALFSSFHSFPLWGLAGGLCWALHKRGAALFCVAGILATAQDFLLHHEDAHAHFFPLTGYRFRSPVSYWNPEYFGQYASLVEVVLVTAASVWTYARLNSWWGKTILVLAVASLVANHAMWSVLFTLF